MYKLLHILRHVIGYLTFSLALRSPYRGLPCHGCGAYARSTIDRVTKLKTEKNKNKNSSAANVSGEEFIVKNVGCVLLPATTSLKAPFRKKIKLFTFINVFMKKNASGAKSRAGRVCMSGTCKQ